MEKIIMEKIVKKILENNQKRNKILFVTVGNGKFDPLIKEIDRLKGEGKIKEDVTMQIGHGSYIPRHCRHFTFEPNLEQYYQKASLIISHGGPGTVFEILRMGQPLIAVPNRDRTDPQHQVEYLQAMAKETQGLLYCDSPAQMEECLRKAQDYAFMPYSPPECTIHEKIHEFLR